MKIPKHFKWKRKCIWFLLVFFAVSLIPESPESKKKLYLSKINVLNGVSDSIKNSLVNRTNKSMRRDTGDVSVARISVIVRLAERPSGILTDFLVLILEKRGIRFLNVRW